MQNIIGVKYYFEVDLLKRSNLKTIIVIEKNVLNERGVLILKKLKKIYRSAFSLSNIF